MRALALVAVVVLAGCAGSNSPSRDLSNHDHATSLSFTLDDFTSDTLALEVVPEEDGVLRMEVRRSLWMASSGPLQASDLDHVCTYAQAGHSSAADFYIHAGDGIAAAAAGEDAEIAFGISSAHVRDPVILEAAVDAGVPVPVRVALHQARSWADAGGHIDIEIRATGGFHHKRLPDPSFQCVTGPQHFEGGAWVDAGLVRSIRDQRVDFPVESPSAGIFLVSADHRYAFTFKDGSGNVVREGSLSLGGMGFNFFVQPLRPDTYAFEVPELTGTNSVNFPTMAVGLVIEGDSPALPAT